MSRIGQKPIALLPGVTASLDGHHLTVTGPKGVLSYSFRREVGVLIAGNRIVIQPIAPSRKIFAYWGLARSLVAGMVEGVSHGFEKKLEIEGIGYRALGEGNRLQLMVGFSHPVHIDAPSGITFRVEKNVITISGIDKALVGDTAARIRRIRPPEPYKGKGIRYVGEVIRRKSGKKAITTTG